MNTIIDTLINLLDNYLDDYSINYTIEDLLELGFSNPNIDMNAVFTKMCLTSNNNDVLMCMLNDQRIYPFYDNSVINFCICNRNYIILENLIKDPRFVSFVNQENNNNYTKYFDFYFTSTESCEITLTLICKLYIDADRIINAIKILKEHNIDYKYIIKKACDLKWN